MSMQQQCRTAARTVVAAPLRSFDMRKNGKRQR